jgi:hypothetical protein
MSYFRKKINRFSKNRHCQQICNLISAIATNAIQVQSNLSKRIHNLLFFQFLKKIFDRMPLFINRFIKSKRCFSVSFVGNLSVNIISFQKISYFVPVAGLICNKSSIIRFRSIV